MEDFRLSPAYDLLNSRIHIEDREFALDDWLLPRNLGQGKMSLQFAILAEQAGISGENYNDIMTLMVSLSDKIQKLITAFFSTIARKEIIYNPVRVV